MKRYKNNVFYNILQTVLKNLKFYFEKAKAESSSQQFKQYP